MMSSDQIEGDASSETESGVSASIGREEHPGLSIFRLLRWPLTRPSCLRRGAVADVLIARTTLQRRGGAGTLLSLPSNLTAPGDAAFLSVGQTLQGRVFPSAIHPSELQSSRGDVAKGSRDSLDFGPCWSTKLAGPQQGGLTS